jgi:hypothetical protein
MATFQKLKNQEAEASQKQLKNFQVRQDSEISQPTPAEQTPN